MQRTRVFLGLAALAALCGPARAESKPAVDDSRMSPNHTPRPSRKIDTIVIHTVQGSYQGALSWFQNRQARVSAHYTISKSGRLGQSVAEKDIAWHAGNWSVNERSIGIEHEGWVSQPGTWTDAMLAKSAALVRHLCQKYGIPMDRKHVIGHVEVPGSDHTDPGPHFPWDRFMRMVREGGGEAAAAEEGPEEEAPASAEEVAPEAEELFASAEEAPSVEETATPPAASSESADEPPIADSPDSPTDPAPAGAERTHCATPRRIAASIPWDLVRRKRALALAGNLDSAESLVEPIRRVREAEEKAAPPPCHEEETPTESFEAESEPVTEEAAEESPSVPVDRPADG